MNEPIRHRRRRRFQLPQPIFLIVLMVGASIITVMFLQELVGLHHRS